MSTISEDMRDVGPWGQAVAIAFRFLLFGAVLIAAGWLVSNVREVPPDSQAIIIRLGAVARVQGPGLLLAWPRPIDQIVVVPAAARQLQLPIARYANNANNGDTTESGYSLNDNPRENTGFLYTGDSSVVRLEAQVFYQINDAPSYFVAMDHVGPALQRLFLASAVDTIAGRDLDAILVARPEIASRADEAALRERLRIDLMNGVNQRLRDLAESGSGLGIVVSRVDLVPSIPLGAKLAFDSVLIVSQEADQEIAEARTRAEMATQQANQSRDRIMTDATAAAQERTSNASISTASIAALAKSGRGMSRGMLMSRLYYERIVPIIKQAHRVELVDKDGTAHLILPGGAE